jgi:hypothetical protein
MHAMTIGLPTVLRQFSMAWVSSRAGVEDTAENEKRTAAKAVLIIDHMKSVSGADARGHEIREANEASESGCGWINAAE